MKRHWSAVVQEDRNYSWPVCILALYLVPRFPKQRILPPLPFYTDFVILNNSLHTRPRIITWVMNRVSVRWTLALSRFFTSEDTEFDVAVVAWRGGGGGCKEKPPPTFLSFPLPEIHITALLVYVRVAWLAHGDVSTTNNSLPTTHI